MTISPYGVVTGRATGKRREPGTSDKPHFQLFMEDNAGTRYQVPVNVLSDTAPSQLLFLADDDFRHPVTDLLPPAGSGWHPLPSHAGTGALDYVRGNLFDPTRMRVLPPDVQGVDNDLEDFLEHYTDRAIADPTVAVYAFGQGFGRVSLLRRLVRFMARGHNHQGPGVHDIHMNQGNGVKHRPDDGVWQDGGLLFHFSAEHRWVAIFLAFQSQAWHTDDQTGHSIGPPSPPGEHEAAVRIVAARVGASAGPDGQSVTLLNASADTVDLGGWRLADERGHVRPLPSRRLAAGGTVTVEGGDGLRLSRTGGALSLLDPVGLKVHGVAYTDEQVRLEGWTTTFA
ncbi:DUF2278 family protein [Streptomyces abikoensis]|uniref:DUF2278 family protein n=1 Tax=Streptomyces abikoensis TaxID=97398 RepID=UPI00368E643D